MSAEVQEIVVTPDSVRESFEQLGAERGLDGRCSVGYTKTHVTFEELGTGYQHQFTFATDPRIEWD